MSDVTISGANALQQLAGALNRAPVAVMQEVDKSMGRAAQEVARKAKELAPKADSTLANSIRARRVTLGEWIAGSNVGHGGAQEKGSREGGKPPLQTILSWINRRGIAPRTPGMSPRDLAWLIQRRIARSGHRAQPHMQPALDSMRPRINQLIGEGMQRGLLKALQR